MDDYEKPVQLPWENEPYVDHKKAHTKAINKAKSVTADPKSPKVQRWAEKAFTAELDRLESATSGHSGGVGRNNQLFISGAALFEIVAAGALDHDRVLDALRHGCRVNQLLQDDGERAVEQTIKSAIRHGYDKPRDLSDVGTNGYEFAGAPTKVIERIDLDIQMRKLERGFWTERESLQRIYLAALSGMCAPWAVLGHCVARALALVPPKVVLPPIIGGGRGGSLNWFCALAAKSGGGKDSSASIAADLVKADIMTRGLGSGEGLVDAYRKSANKATGEPAGFYESIMFAADEIDTMAALSQRSGSTLTGLLRTAFSGARLDFGYRKSNGLEPVEAHTYRMTLTVSVQPARAGALLDDVYGGTLQRFMWFPASDKRVSPERPPRQAALDIPSPSAWMYDMELQIPYEASELIIDEAVRRHHGLGDDVEGHALFIREKFAYALAVIDGRADRVTSEDWRLAGIASRISQLTRSWVAQELEDATQAEDAKQGARRGRQSAAADETKAEVVEDRMMRMANRIRDKIKEAGIDGAKQGNLSAALGKNARFLPNILEALQSRGEIESVKGKRGGLVWKFTNIPL